MISNNYSEEKYNYRACKAYQKGRYCFFCHNIIAVKYFYLDHKSKPSKRRE